MPAPLVLVAAGLLVFAVVCAWMIVQEKAAEAKGSDTDPSTAKAAVQFFSYFGSIAMVIAGLIWGIASFSMTAHERINYVVAEDEKEWTVESVHPLQALGTDGSATATSTSFSLAYISIAQESDLQYREKSPAKGAVVIGSVSTIQYLEKDPEDGSVTIGSVNSRNAVIHEIDPEDDASEPRLEVLVCTVVASHGERYVPTGEPCGREARFYVPEGSISSRFDVSVGG